jgi:hypothetical protein
MAVNDVAETLGSSTHVAVNRMGYQRSKEKYVDGA